MFKPYAGHFVKLYSKLAHKIPSVFLFAMHRFQIIVQPNEIIRWNLYLTILLKLQEAHMARRLKQDISIGSNLRKYRQASGLSQEAVAAKLQLQSLDISREVISQMELGTYNIRVSILLALAEIYDISIQNFFVDLERYEQDEADK